MTIQYALTERQVELKNLIASSFNNSLYHSQAFSVRILGPELAAQTLNEGIFDLSNVLRSIDYGGFPSLAAFGFSIGARDCHNLSQDAVDAFLAGLGRLQNMGSRRLQDLANDDVALLGLADGISKLSVECGHDVSSALLWLAELLRNYTGQATWSTRIRALAADLLDDLGRLRSGISNDSADVVAVELCLQASWPSAFRNSVYPDWEVRSALLKSLLIESLPADGDLERAAIWLKAIDLLLDSSIEVLIPSVSDIARLLKNTQHSFKRWVWDETTRRGHVDPVHWLIDDEGHVQSFLWAVLYPIYGSDLVDETYLPGYGQVQPRFDLGVKKLKLIIEVKMIRDRGDFAKIEEEVAGDLGLYFKETDQFDCMVVYVYDDCDVQYSERYDALMNALKGRGRIEDVVIVRRPSMIPNRDQRKILVGSKSA